jgi:hypothetical protein
MHDTMASNQALAGPITVHDFDDPTSVMWAVLALYALRSDVRSDFSYGPEYRDDVLDAFFYFASSFTPELKHRIEARHTEALDRIPRNFSLDGNNLPHTHYYDIDPQLCCHLLKYFVRRDWNEDDMKTQLTDLMRDLLHDSMVTSLRSFNDEPQDDDTMDTVDNLLADTLAEEAYIIIKKYLSHRLDMLAFAGYVPPANSGRALKAGARVELLDWVYDTVYGFLRDNRYARGANGIETVLNKLYVELAEFFSPQSTLLDADWDRIDMVAGAIRYIDEEIEPYDENIPIIEPGDTRYMDEDLELDDLEDVLMGPEHASIDDVSIAFEYEHDQSSCALCGDDDVPMRKLEGCGHELCEECLRTQLNTNHACRYKCAFCRNEFFQRTD